MSAMSVGEVVRRWMSVLGVSESASCEVTAETTEEEGSGRTQS